MAVGDRVILRRNERGVDVDNGMRGTVRHVHANGITIETDAHLIRELPAEYVAEHVEHAYALTGHGMQGATVERAVVLASVHDLSRGWSYTALSRARGETRLLITDTPAISEERADARARSRARRAPTRSRRLPASLAGCANATTRTWPSTSSQPRRTSPRRRRAAIGGPLQERAASESEPAVTEPRAGDVAALRARVTSAAGSAAGPADPSA